MKAYRKYFDEAQLERLAAESPGWGVDILTVGHNIHPAQRPYPDPLHPASYYFNWDEGRKLDEFQLVYIASGQGMFESESVAPTLIEGGMAFLLYPGVWHRFRPTPQTGWEEFWVGFRGNYAEYLLRQECFSASRPLVQVSFRSEIFNVFVRIIDAFTYEGLAYRQIATCQIIQLLGLVYASALSKNGGYSRAEQLVHQVRYQIQNNYSSTIDFESLAKEQGVSYVWFRKAFKKVMGTSPGQYHLALRLDKAIQQLSETDLSVSEIAYQTGFESLFHFSRIFKKKIGYAPSLVRTAILSK